MFRCFSHALWLGQSMDDYQSFEGTILEIRRNFVRIAFSRAASDGMEECPRDSVWRMDKYSPETTFQRQLKVRCSFPHIPLYKCQIPIKLRESVHEARWKT
jgi:hypothetical protein